MCTSLLGRPPFQRAEIEQAVDEIDKGFSVLHFCFVLAEEQRSVSNTALTSFDLVLLHALTWHRIVPYDLWQP